MSASTKQVANIAGQFVFPANGYSTFALKIGFAPSTAYLGSSRCPGVCPPVLLLLFTLSGVLAWLHVTLIATTGAALHGRSPPSVPPAGCGGFALRLRLSPRLRTWLHPAAIPLRHQQHREPGSLAPPNCSPARESTGLRWPGCVPHLQVSAMHCVSL